MTPPPSADWTIDPSNPRQQRAHQRFFGKTLAEVDAFFALNPILYHEDFWWMPAAPFRYYLQSYIRYLRSTHSQSDIDTARAFLILVGRLIRSDPERLQSVWDTVEPTLDYIAANQEWFDADPARDGSLHAIVNNLKNAVSLTHAG